MVTLSLSVAVLLSSVHPSTADSTVKAHTAETEADRIFRRQPSPCFHRSGWRPRPVISAARRGGRTLEGPGPRKTKRGDRRDAAPPTRHV